MPLRTLATDQRGFTMVTLMGVMLIVVSLVFVTYSAADGDLAPGKHDEERKVAYAAGEAGVQNYLFHLTQNDDYWSQCDQVPGPHAVHLAFGAGGIPADARRLKVPGSPASYVIEMLPANGNAACVPGSTDSMIDAATGTFRIRVTGFSDDATPAKRSIIATFRRKSFLEYIYFTDYETQDPAVYKAAALGLETLENPRTPSSLPQRDVVQWGTETCATKHWGEGRGSIPDFVGNQNDTGILFGGTWYPFSARCGEIQFIGPTSGPTDGNSAPTSSDRDVIRGSLHTNDSILVCGAPRFGRTPQDKIEVAGSPGWRSSGCSNSAPNVNGAGGPGGSQLGTWAPNSAPLTLPPSNGALRTDALAAYRFKGRTKIRLNGAQMFISGTRENGSVLDNANVPLPANGVLYASNEGSCGRYDPVKPYPAPAPSNTTDFGTGCGNVEVEGTYSVSLTIGAANDILVTEDVIKSGGYGTPTPAPDVLFGLIANNFVRVYHPVTTPTISGGRLTCSNDGGPAQDVRIDAAILAIGHSFIHDNYYCGATTGTLTVNGAIAQRYRGAVGTSSGGSPVTGFKKDYVYDNRMKFRSPPHFIDPIAAGWQVQLYTEQNPAK